jgi:endo-1,4-beta-xylanase
VPGSGGNPPAATSTGSTPTPSGGGSSASGLHNKFKAKGKLYFGTEIDHYHLNNNQLTTIVKNSFGQVTAENSMKWDATERERFHSPSSRQLAQANQPVNHSEPQSVHILQR